MRFAPTVLLVVAALAFDAPARAQCGAALSECRNCHEIRGERPVLAGASPWHRDHAFGDFCALCHGGNAQAKDAAAAHLGVASPMASPAAACAPCHGAATDDLAGRYSRARAAAPPAPPAAGPPSSTAPPAASSREITLAAAVLLVALAGLAYVARWRPRLDLVAWLRAGRWSPYVAGAGLGLTVTASMALFGKRLSGAGAYQHFSGYVGRWLAPDAAYWKHVVPAGLTWEIVLLVGTLLGALASALASKQFAWRTMPDSQWSDVFGPSVAKRWAIVFVGTLLIELAAGIAGGCTASLAISSGAAFAPAAFLFMAGMFAGGIPVAWLVHRRASPAKGVGP